MGGTRSSSSAGAGIPLAVRSREEKFADLLDSIQANLPEGIRTTSVRPKIEIVADDEFISNAAAIVTDDGKTVAIRESIARDIDRYLEGERNDTTIAAWSTLVHESLHLQSPPVQNGKSTTADLWFEEGFVERTAQRYVANTYPMSRIPGIYRSHVAAVDSLSRAIGEETVQQIWRQPTSQARMSAMHDPIGSWLTGRILRVGGTPEYAKVVVDNFTSRWRLFNQGRAHEVHLARNVRDITRLLGSLEPAGR